MSSTSDSVAAEANRFSLNQPLPEKVSLEGLEEKFDTIWHDNGTYKFSRETTREQVYSIDTPPPTVSGSLHVGHVFSYTHTDIVARFWRMNGKNVFYPMGWDDNGLPTERRVQNYYGVRCDPTLPYDPNFTPPFQGGDGKSVKAADQIPISRKNFIELCEQLTEEDEKVFESLWRKLGLSVDWNMTYQTIDASAQRVAQTAFVRNLKRGEAYQAQAPGLWDVTFQTAVAQAELEARDYPGHYHAVRFHSTQVPAGIVIETTRPELLPACVALIAHPDDERYQNLFGTTVTSPLFDVEIPVLAHPSAEPDKGAGIAMCCTFGDLTDVQWWRELNLPMRSIIGRDGRIIDPEQDWITSLQGQSLFQELIGKTTFSARKAIVEALVASGDLIGEPSATNRKTNFFEKGDKPLEIVTSRQWYIRNGGKDEALRNELLQRGKELNFNPDFMSVRYENWVKGLNGDWLISRQRFFGVPIPVWYPLDANGESDWQNPIIPDEASLPVDPSSDVPAGYTAEQRGKPGGFIGEVDIMDTWATSSLTPQIAGGWLSDETLFANVFPMDLRPQGQDIIRTWLFSTVVRANHEHKCLPWKSAAISGWILDPDRKKMSKSKGNVVTPAGLLDEHGSDAVRYWAASARLGTDAAFEVGQMKIGRRLAIKILNASKFALSFSEDSEFDLCAELVTEPIDRAFLAALKDVIVSATKSLKAYDHTRALELSETLFWTFCDDYLELIKDRAYGNGTFTKEQVASARTTLALSLDSLLRLFAPFLPFATDEVWSWWRKGSIHVAPWPTGDGLEIGIKDQSANLLTLAGQALANIRKTKTEAKVSMKTPILKLTLQAPQNTVADLEAVRQDLRQAGRIEGDFFIEATSQGTEGLVVSDVVLGEPPAKK